MRESIRFYRMASHLFIDSGRRRRLPELLLAAKPSKCPSRDVLSLQLHYFDTRCLSAAAEKDASEDGSSSAASIAWNARYQELLQYIKDHGNALVPRDYKANPSLGRWVDKQREKYKSSDISPDRIDQLNAVSFVWQPQEELWSERFNELLAYIKDHGNALVPQEYEENISLGHWVQKQRYKYKTNAISKDRIQQLTSVGFVFDVLEAQWLEKFDLMKKYRREYGDTLVPRQHALGSWVWWQRREYKAFMERKKVLDEQNKKDATEAERTDSSKLKTGMTEERIKLLESVDFIWEPKEFLWNLKYEELREWIALNGHGAITMRKKKNGPLELWATRQRKMYKQYCNGEKSSLTKERIEKLQSIGFVFDLGK